MTQREAQDFLHFSLDSGTQKKNNKTTLRSVAQRELIATNNYLQEFIVSTGGLH